MQKGKTEREQYKKGKREGEYKGKQREGITKVKIVMVFKKERK